MSATRQFTFVVPGDIRTRTGGYEYDRHLIEALRARGWQATVSQLRDGFPHPTKAARIQAALALTLIPDDSPVIIDGLALGVLPDEVAAQMGRLRLIGLVHHPLALETGLSSEDAEQLFRSEQRALACVRRVVVTSPGTADALMDYRVRRAEITVAIPGTDHAPLASGSGGPSTRLLCVASVVPRKGHDVLVQALASLRDLPWQLVCAGSLERDPGWTRQLRAMIHEADLDDRLEFVGELHDEEMAREYDRADIFVLPTRYEGYGMVVAEALARGLPIVATNTGGIANLLADGAGILVPPDDVAGLADALRRVIVEPSTRASLAESARTRRQLLPSWADAAAIMESVLLKVTG